MRKALYGAAIGALLLALYAAAGYWLAPRLLLDALQERAAAAGLTLSVEDVATDPFRLNVGLQGVTVSGPQGRLAAAEALRMDLAWASLWSDDWIVQDATIASPVVDVVLGREGVTNWPAGGGNGNGGKAGAAKPMALSVQKLAVSEGTVRIVDRTRGEPVELTLKRLGLQVQNLATRQGEAQYRLDTQLGEGGTLRSEGTFSLAPLAAHGEVGVSGLALAKVWEIAAPASKPAQGRLGANAFYAYRDGKLVVRDLYAEASPAAYAGIELFKATIEAPEIAFPPTGRVPVAAHVQLKPSGTAAAKGTVELRPFAADLQLTAMGVPLALAQRYLPQSVALDVASGSVSGKGALQIGKGGASYQGSAEVVDLKLEERGSRQVLLGWKRAQTAALDVSPGGLEIGEATVQAPQGRLVIDEEGRINFGQAFKPAKEKKDGEPFRTVVRRLALEEGTLHFADRSLETPFEVTMRELSGTVTGFSTEPGNPALVALEGRVGEYGAVRIRGTVNLDDPKSLADMNARFRNVALAQLTPYIVKFAGYRVESGRVSANLRYRVREGRLTGENQLVFQELELGEKVARPGAKDLPLELAVALLADAKGRITLDIPVRGNLNDPQFDFGGLVSRALGNVIGKIVSAPFRALAAAFGGKGAENLAEVRFEPGSAELSPPQEESVARVAKALGDRPQLGLIVRGAFDPERDAAALRMQAVRREIAARAGYKSPGPLDFNDPKTVRAAESLYLERIGNRGQLQALQKEAPRYGRALVELLAYTLPADTGDPRALAQRRGEAVRDALVEQGVSPKRIAVGDPAAGDAAMEGVPTQLSLAPLSQ